MILGLNKGLRAIYAKLCGATDRIIQTSAVNSQEEWRRLTVPNEIGHGSYAAGD